MSSELTVIEARKDSGLERLLEIWKYRGFYGFLLREISMRKFRETILGFWWLIVRPLIPAIMVIVTFTQVVQVESGELPYALFFLAGYACWSVFQSTAAFMPRTLRWMQGIMSKTYFPRLLVPLASVGPPLIELAIALVLLALGLLYFFIIDGELYVRGDAWVLVFPLCLLGALMLALASGMVTSVLALLARDVIFSINYFVQILMFLTPVIYPVSAVPESIRPAMFIINPMSVYVEAARWSLTGHGFFDLTWFLVAVGITIFVFSMSVWFFFRSESFLGDTM